MPKTNTLGLILAALLIIPSAAATLYTENHGYSSNNQNTGQINEIGMMIQPRYSGTLRNVTLFTGANATRCMLKETNDNVLATASCTGGTCQFNYNTTGGTTYAIACDNSGATYTTKWYEPVPSFPITGTAINWIDGWINHGQDGGSNNIWIIQSVQYDYTPANSTFNFSIAEHYNGSAISGVAITTSIGTCTTSAAGTCSLNTSDYSITSLTYNASKNGYFNVSDSVAANTTATFNLTQAIYNNLTILEKITGNAVNTPFNITVTGGRTYTLTGATTAIYLKAGDNTLTFSKNGYYNLTFTKTVTALTNTTTNASDAYTAQYTVHARNLSNASITTPTTYQLTSSGYTENQTSSNGNATFNLTSGDYTITVTPTDYSAKTHNAAITTGATNYYSIHYPANTLIFSIYDENNASIINYATIRIELISENYSRNYTTNTGTLTATNLQATTYNIRYSATGYATRTYAFTLEQDQYYTLNLTLLASNSATTANIYVYDTLDNPISGAIVKLQKYDVTTNTFITNQILTTNYAGQTTASIVLNNEYYKTIIEYNGAVIYTTSPSYFYGTEVKYYINLASDSFEDFFTTQRLTGTITHNQATNTTTYTWNDANNIATQGCVYAYRTSGTTRTLLNNTCSASPSGTIYLGLDAQSGATYTLIGTITAAGTEHTVITVTTTYDAPEDEGGDGMLLMFIVMLLVGSIALWNLQVSVVLVGLIPLLFSIAGLVSLSVGVTAPIFLISLIVAYILGRTT